ncbi:hypothetical protein AL038_07685 [Beggiatoa leptomitoformis]|uniref:Translocation and assembly module TamB C-terminal domain-containing protein n=1 Tax=Beggiatoa leptomitoformis TaxID=288004 RepID=A0A2N9YI75_9GAMM|nr:translocation/assembly module TamB domain-containing protein [Beggiatoa leptomitoformis]ALG67605.1 hypothetical protein AL038_07685 [Beggiatoa leptomitoformis]AUI70163.1 hypothetical protein BLE401_16630 [Beggiatoa leptomitoformis]
MKRWLKRLLLVLLIGLILVLLMAGWGAGTETGSHWMIRLVQHWIPGELTIQQIDGSLLNRLVLKNVHYQQESAIVDAETLVFAWQPTDLFDLNVHVQQIMAENVNVIIPPSTTTSPPSKDPFTLPEIRLPVGITIDDVQLKNFTLQTGDKSTPFTLTLEQAQLGATIKEQISLLNLSMTGVQTQGIHAGLQAKGHYGLTRPHAVLLDLQWTAQLPQIGEINGQGKIDGDINKLSLTHHVSEPIALQLNANVTELFNKLGWQADIQWQDIFYPLDNSPKLIRSQAGKITSNGNLEAYQLTIQTALSGKDVPATALQLNANGDLHSLTLEKLRLALLEGVIQAQGKIDWQTLLQANLQLDISQLKLNNYIPNLPENVRLNNQLSATLTDKNWTINQQTKLSNTTTQLNLTGKGTLVDLNNPDINVVLDWQNVQYPLVGQSIINIPTGKATLAGQLQNYQLELTTQVKTPQIPDSQWKLTAQGDLNQLQQGQLKGELLQGQIVANVNAQWANQLQAMLDVQVSEIPLAPFMAELPPSVKLNAAFSANLQNDKVKIQQGQISLPPTAAQITLAGEGLLTPADNPSFQADLTWKNLQFPLIGEPQVQTQQGTVKLSGTLQAYQLTLDSDLSGQQLPKGQWQAEINGDTQHIELQKLQGELLQGLVTANGKLELQPLKATLLLSLDKLVLNTLIPDVPATHKLSSQLRAEFADQQLHLAEFKLTLPPSNINIGAQADVNLNDATNPSFTSQLTWQGLRYPLEGKQLLLKDAKGNIELKGTANDYQLALLADIVGQEQIPSGRVTATGNGDKKGFKLKQLQGKLLDGVLNLTGQVAWSPAVQWSMNLMGKKLNLAPYTQQQSNIDLDIRSTGKLENNQLNAEVKIVDIKGKIGTYPLQLQAEATAQGERYNLKKFNFVSGKNHIIAQADYDKTINAMWTIDAPALAELLPQAGGSLQGSGKINGSLNNPKINATLQAKQLAYAENRLASLDVKIDADLQGKQGLNLSLQAADFFQSNEKVIDKIEVNGQGQLAQHSLTATIKAPENNLFVKIDGGLVLTPLRWQGQISQVTANLEKAGQWSLPKPAPINASADAAQLSNFCVQGYLSRRQPDSLTSICVTSGWQAKTGAKGDIVLSKIPLRLLVPTVTGTIEGHLSGTYQPDGTLRADALLDVSPGRLLPATDDPATKPIAHNGGKIKLIIDNTGLNGSIFLDLAKQNTINGTITMQGFNRLPLRPDQPIQANLQANFNDLGLLPDILSQAEKAKGAANFNLTIAGTVADPIVQGQFLIKKVEVGLPDLGLEIKDFNADIKTTSRDTIDINMGLQSGKGQLKITGNVKLLTLTDWQAAIAINGENVQVVNTPDAIAEITPDLRLTMSAGKIDLSGKVLIPYANITPTGAAISGTGGGSVIGISPDVVIINPDKPSTAEKATKGWEITSTINVVLGNDIHLAVMDFNSSFTGALSITLSPNQTMPRATGELQILDGTYRAYGQDLEIERGRIIFAGGGWIILY